jgi:hypothetical protein
MARSSIFLIGIAQGVTTGKFATTPGPGFFPGSEATNKSTASALGTRHTAESTLNEFLRLQGRGAAPGEGFLGRQ